MIINRDSWHYKWMDKMDFRPYDKESLCPYVRALFWCALFTLFISALFTLVVLWPTGAFLGWAAACITTWSIIPVGGAVKFFLSAVAMGTAFLCAGICGYYWQEYRDARWEKIRQMQEDGTYVEPEPNIIWEYIVAIHEKVCPKIEFK